MGRLLAFIPSRLSLFLVIAATTLLLPRSHASHIMAGDLTYRFLGGLSYEITLKLYRDCSGVDLASTANIRLRSSCYRDTNAVLNLLNGSGNILPLICPAQQANSACLGGSLLGVKEYIYQDTVTLPTSCFDWQFSWTSCCRNAAITNLTNPYTRSFYLETYLNHELTGGNSSPSFGSIPTPYICLGQPFAYTQGASEVDGDSLVYSLVSPQTSAVGTIPHSPGYSATQPVSPSLSINRNTGQLFFTPNVQQVAIVGILVEEYRNDSLIGSTRRDLQIIVLNCNNSFPFLSPSQAINVQAPAVQSSPLVLEICPDNNLSFELQGLDLDIGDSVYIEQAGSLPVGVNLMPNPGQGSGTLTVDWMPTAGDIGTYVLEFLVRDNNCPLLGIQRYAVTIKVLDRTRAGQDLFYCPAGGPVQLGAVGGKTFIWTDMNLNPVPPGELSCDTCPNPLASPPVTTTYVVTSDLGNCVNTDTVTVNVVSDINLITGAVRDTICQGDTTEIFAVPSPAVNVTFDWLPRSSLSQPTSLTPLAFPSQHTHYIVEASSTTGCKVKDTVEIHVIDLDIDAVAPKDKVCRLDSSVALYGLVQSNVPYYVNWKDPLGANLGQRDSITFTAYFSGNYSLTLTDSTQYCSAQDSIHIDVMDLTVLPANNAICAGDSVNLQANYSGPTGLFYPSQCGPRDSCCGPRYHYLVGDTCNGSVQGGTTACQVSGLQSTAYRASFESSRIQYIFHEAELQAAGFLGGSIEAISFHLAWVLTQGRRTGLDEMVIKMGCTNEDSMNSFLDGLTTVWGPAPFQPQMGFNTHELEIAYDWPGSGNLVIQICAIDSTDPAGFAFYETSANTYSYPPTVKADRFNIQPPCELGADTAIIYQRPAVRFSVCVEGLDPVYTWTPAAGLSNPNIPNPKASPAINTTYMLNVSVADSCICQLEKPATVNINGCILDEAILAFQVEKQGNAARIAWQVDPAFASADFWVEKLISGTFTPIVMADSLQEAVTWDADLTAGEHLYRLHLQDVNGISNFSQVKSVYIDPWESPSRIYPNPVHKGKPVFVHGEENLNYIRIYNPWGKKVYEGKFMPEEGIPTQSLEAGVYLIQTGNEVFKVVILK